MKRWHTLIGVACLLATAGCAHRTADNAVVVDVWSGWTGAEADSFQKLCDDFSRTHPGIRIHNLGGITDNQKVVRAITAGVPPDAFTIWSAPDCGPLAAYGAVRNVDPYFKASGLKESDFLPGALPLCKYQGHFIGLPLLMDTTALLWNKEAFREAGLDPNRPPQTLDELKEYATRLTKRDGHGEITRLGLMLPDTTLLCWLHGGEFLNPKTGAITANSPENVRALTYYKGLVDAMGGREKVDAFGSGFGQGQGPNHPFFVGKAAMMLSGEWIPSWIEKYAPRLQYGVAPVPYDVRHPELKGTTSTSVNLLAIPSEAKHPKEAWQFLVWLQTTKAQTQFAEALNNVPNMKAAARQPSLIEGSPRRRMFGKFLAIAQHKNARGFPITPVGQLYQDELGKATEFVLFGVKSPQRALDDVQAKVSKELASKTNR